MCHTEPCIVHRAQVMEDSDSDIFVLVYIYSTETLKHTLKSWVLVCILLAIAMCLHTEKYT